MKRQACAVLLGAALLLGSQSASAQEATYVFSYEGFRYTQRENETVLTQTNLGEHEDLLHNLGTTKEAVLASYIASGIVMEVIPDDGGQIAVSVTDAGNFADVGDMDDLSDECRLAFLAQFEMSGLYESCAYVHTSPECVRLTSSAMYASMPVYSLRYATLHLGRLYMIEQTIVGREPTDEDDARMERLLENIKLLSSVSTATPTPTVMPTATPAPTLEPENAVAEVEIIGDMTLAEMPSYLTQAQFTISGTAAASAELTITTDGEQLAKTTAKKDGSFSAQVKLPDEGEYELKVVSGESSAAFTVRYKKPAARLEITEPTESVFTGSNVMVRGVTEPNATVYITGKGMSTNVKANRNGVFSIRVFMDDAGTETYTLTAKADGCAQSSVAVTLTREWTEKELITQFRQKMIAVSYKDLAKDPAKYAGKRFIFRGKVMSFTDYDGKPCALVCVDNPSTGVWQSPIYIVLQTTDEVKEGDVMTFYLIGEELTLPVDAEDSSSGKEEEVPVARAIYITNNK